MSELTSSDKDEQIRHRAYMLWLDEGQPEGREAEHWDRACALIEADKEAQASSSAEPHRDAATQASSATSTR